MQEKVVNLVGVIILLCIAVAVIMGVVKFGMVLFG